jgi:hypothetical protein
MSRSPVLPLLKFFSACDGFVGRAPRPAADPLVGLLETHHEPDQGSSADGGVRPTFGCGHVGQTIAFCRLSTVSSIRAKTGNFVTFYPFSSLL